MCTISGHDITIPCPPGPVFAGTCNYSLSSNNNTLTISCPGMPAGGNIVLTRQ
jgi:hypothetical protein